MSPRKVAVQSCDVKLFEYFYSVESQKCHAPSQPHRGSVMSWITRITEVNWAETHIEIYLWNVLFIFVVIVESFPKLNVECCIDMQDLIVLKSENTGEQMGKRHTKKEESEIKE